MKMTRLTVTLALLTALTACTAERALAPQPSARSLGTSLIAAGPPQLPLLFVVDGVRYQRGQVPALTADQVFEVLVIKGHAALKQYGPDASYGVVVITTRQAVGPRS